MSINSDATKVVAGAALGKINTYINYYGWSQPGSINEHGYIQTYYWGKKSSSSEFKNGIIDSVSDANNLGSADSLSETSTVDTYASFFEYEHSRLSAPSNTKGFGMSCSMSDDGDLLVVGAPFTSINNNDNCGTVYTYDWDSTCLLYTSPSPRDLSTSRMPSSA